jgi:hypothetical protein
VDIALMMTKEGLSEAAQRQLPAGDQRDVSLSQVWRAPSDSLSHFLLTTSQFTMGRCSALLWVADADVRVLEASDR